MLHCPGLQIRAENEPLLVARDSNSPTRSPLQAPLILVRPHRSRDLSIHTSPYSSPSFDQTEPERASKPASACACVVVCKCARMGARAWCSQQPAARQLLSPLLPSSRAPLSRSFVFRNYNLGRWVGGHPQSNKKVSF